MGQLALSKDLEVTVLSDINDSNVVSFGLRTGLLSDKAPKFVQVDDRSKLLVSLQVEVSLASLSEVAWMTKQQNKQTHTVVTKLFTSSNAPISLSDP